jgi:NADH:ubiquinone oxidoreductase subunit E
MNESQKKELDEIVEKYRKLPNAKIKILQETQLKFDYLSGESMRHIAEALGVSYTEIYGIATFYSFFNLSPPGEHTINVCLGTSCHVKGGDEILEELQKTLGVDVGETTKDGLFSIKTVRCLGCCGLSPVIDIDGKTFGRVKKAKVSGLLEPYREVKE